LPIPIGNEGRRSDCDCSCNVLLTSHSQTSSFNYSYGLSQWNHQHHKLWCPDDSKLW